MLRQLYIENLAVIRRADITLTPGFNVFTGETGAGKTILVTAINAILGQRIQRDIIRTGEQRAVVTALFTALSPQAAETLESLGYTPEEDGTLLITRAIRPDANDCRVNGRPATTAVLKSLAPHLVDLHGQHDNARLLSPEYHLSLIDQFGGLRGKVAEYGEAYRQMCRLGEELREVALDEGAKARRIDLLTYQIEEIEKAQLAPGEEEELEAQRNMMRNAEKIAGCLSKAKELLNPEYGEQQGLLEQLAGLQEALEGAARFIAELEGAAGRLSEMAYELSDLDRDIAGCAESLEFDPRQLDAAEGRLSLLHTLKAKYGGSVEEVLAFCARAREELDLIERADERRGQLQAQHAQAAQRAQHLADALTAARREAGQRFARAVEQELNYLDMPSVRLTVAHQKGKMAPSGQDDMVLLISANPGEPPKPVNKIASGGEISRIMLSVKNVLSADGDGVTSIFDEVDTGVSGRAADKIGHKLSAVASGRQVLCVTHLAQVAAYADNHLLIEKKEEQGRASTQVRTLSGELHARELARIISGDAVTEAAVANAKEMIALADGKKRGQAV